MAFKKDSISVEILRFLRKIRFFLYFIEKINSFRDFIFKPEIKENDDNLINRFSLFCNWIVFEILINGFLWCIAILIVFQTEISIYSIFYPIGLGLLRFVFLDIISDLTMILKKKW